MADDHSRSCWFRSRLAGRCGELMVIFGGRTLALPAADTSSSSTGCRVRVRCIPTRRRIFTARPGRDDQIIAVVPSLDLVIVRHGVNPPGVGGEAISPDQNILSGKITRAFGYAGQAQPLSLKIAPSAGGIQLNWTSWYGRSFQPQQSVNPGQTPWLERRHRHQEP